VKLAGGEGKVIVAFAALPIAFTQETELPETDNHRLENL
jgi:hypothetical protein